MNKKKLCGCGEKATIESIRKMIACDLCTSKFQELEYAFERFQKQKREKSISNNDDDVRQFIRNYNTEYEVYGFKLIWKGKSWAIMSGRNCYDKKRNAWVYEPLPSNRDELFFESCRFNLVEALKLLSVLKKQVPETANMHIEGHTE